MSQKGGGKLFYINNLRTVMIILIVMLHLAITYGAPGSWYYSEGTDDPLTVVVLALFNVTVQAFTLSFFFMISAYFMPGSYQRRGAWSYLKNRLTRMGIPLAIFYFLINPLIVYVIFARSMGRPFSYFHSFSTGPLWFVQVLLMFSILYIIWMKYMPKMAVKKRAPPQSKQIAAFILMLSTATFLVRIFWPIGKAISNLQFGFFPSYIAFFIVGIMAHGNRWFDDFDEEIGRRWLKVGILAIPMFLVIMIVGKGLEDVDPFFGGLHWQSLAYSTWDALVGTGLIAGLFVVFRKRFNYETNFSKLLSDNAYTVFIIQAPMIVFLTYPLRVVEIYPLLKFALMSVIVISLSFVISHLVLRRLPYADRVL
ncbi:MAG: acyltransferase family protein [Candidatus Hydrothermarchaeales archaeon]